EMTTLILTIRPIFGLHFSDDIGQAQLLAVQKITGAKLPVAFWPDDSGCYCETPAAKGIRVPEESQQRPLERCLARIDCH
ncbi:hypothetical protein, partial [Pseudomonas aeruginosa]|uniref:hypothetical protein n=1 Tax=Pseudomonas aeruginosa TaxID=287 RepID=UPI002FE036E5